MTQPIPSDFEFPDEASTQAAITELVLYSTEVMGLSIATACGILIFAAAKLLVEFDAPEQDDPGIIMKLAGANKRAEELKESLQDATTHFCQKAFRGLK